MSKRAMAGAVVAVFAVAVAAIAVTASGGGSSTHTLQKLPIGSASGRAAAQDSMGTSAMLAPIRPVEYRVAPGLPTLGGTATAYKLSSAVESGAMTRLARALNINGTMKTDPDGEVVSDGLHALRVTKDASLPWSYGLSYACAPDVAVSSDGVTSSSGSGCSLPTGTVSSGSASTGGGSASSPGSSPETKPPADPGANQPTRTPVPPETPVPTRPADLPSRDADKAIAVRVAAATGADLTGADIRIEDGMTQWLATIDLVVDGHAVIGMPTSVAVGDKGIVTYASGFLARPTSLGDYPLVGTPKGIERLKSGFGVGPVPMMGAAESGVAKDAPAVASDTPAGGPVPTEPDGGPTTSIAPLVRTITGVSLALTYVADYSAAGRGAGYLVPAYLFTLDDGTTTSMVAVTDDLLATTTGSGTGGTDVVPDGKK
jgi:hypothetical protein